MVRHGRLIAIAGACLLAPLALAALARNDAEPAVSTVQAEAPPPSTVSFVKNAPPTATWAPMTRAVWARTSPDQGAAQVERVRLRTPEGTTNLVHILDRTRNPTTDRVWLKVRLASLPNGKEGWIPRNAVGGQQRATTLLEVDTERLELRLTAGDRLLLKAPIGVGKADTPTPQGRFYIRNKLTRYSSPFYGPLAFGTSARSSVLTDWPADGHIGIHGTNEPDLLPGRVSHGCIRLRNPDIQKLGDLMPVGTPLVIT